MLVEVVEWPQTNLEKSKSRPRSRCVRVWAAFFSHVFCFFLRPGVSSKAKISPLSCHTWCSPQPKDISAKARLRPKRLSWACLKIDEPATQMVASLCASQLKLPLISHWVVSRNDAAHIAKLHEVLTGSRVLLFRLRQRGACSAHSGTPKPSLSRG